MVTEPDRAPIAGSPALATLMLSLGRLVVGRLVVGRLLTSPFTLAPAVRRRRGAPAESR